MINTYIEAIDRLENLLEQSVYNEARRLYHKMAARLNPNKTIKICDSMGIRTITFYRGNKEILEWDLDNQNLEGEDKAERVFPELKQLRLLIFKSEEYCQCKLGHFNIKGAKK